MYRKKMSLCLIIATIFLMFPLLAEAEESICITCHNDVTPGIVKDFLSGAMGKSGMDCSDCHGSNHISANDTSKVQLPTEKTCQKCHEIQVEQYMSGKHSLG